MTTSDPIEAACKKFEEQLNEMEELLLKNKKAPLSGTPLRLPAQPAAFFFKRRRA